MHVLFFQNFRAQKSSKLIAYFVPNLISEHYYFNAQPSFIHINENNCEDSQFQGPPNTIWRSLKNESRYFQNFCMVRT